MKRRERVCRVELPIEVQAIPKARVCNWQMLDERACFPGFALEEKVRLPDIGVEIGVANRDYHHLSQFEIDGEKRIYQQLTGRYTKPQKNHSCLQISESQE